MPAASPQGAVRPCATFVHGRAGIACMRLRTREGELLRCGPYEALAGAIAQRLPPSALLHAYGAAEGVAPALGERGIIVRATAPDREVPALAIALRAIASGAKARVEAHAVRADYGEMHYAEPAAKRGGVT